MVVRRDAVPGDPADIGFTLIETIIALFMLALVVLSITPLFVGVLQATSGLGGKQAAIAVASQQLEFVRSVNPTKLLSGRYSGDVSTLLSSPGLVILSGDDVTPADNSDPIAASGSASAVVPLSTTQTLNGVVYTARTYIDRCYLSKITGVCTASAANGPAAYRISIDVSWPARPGVRCRSGRAGQCEYVTSTLIDASDDPVFSSNSPPTLTIAQDVTGSTPVTLGTLHPGQLITMKLLGSNFSYGAAVYSSNGDVVGPVISNTGTSLTVQYQVSSSTGTRSVVVVNPNGTSTSTSVTVATSTPTVTALSPLTAARLVAKSCTLTGTDLFATPSTAAAVVQPTVSMAGTFTYNGSTGTIWPPTVIGVTVTSSTSLTFTATFPGYLGGYTANMTLTLTNPDGGTATKALTIAVS